MSARPPTSAAAPDWTDSVATDSASTDSVAIDSIRRFRYSALTLNAHRIHCDLPYAREVEKYPGLVVHRPLQAMPLMAAARAHQGGCAPASFSYRGIRPLFHFDALRPIGWPAAGTTQNLATVIDGSLSCRQAKIGWPQ